MRTTNILYVLFVGTNSNFGEGKFKLGIQNKRKRFIFPSLFPLVYLIFKTANSIKYTQHIQFYHRSPMGPAANPIPSQIFNTSSHVLI